MRDPTALQPNRTGKLPGPLAVHIRLGALAETVATGPESVFWIFAWVGVRCMGVLRRTPAAVETI